MALANKIDSNNSGLRYAEEASIGTLPASPTWTPLEPNSYNDFGGEISTTARNPINASRQRRKGVVTDLDSSGGFEHDFTYSGFQDLLQGFVFADFRRKAEFSGSVTAANADSTFSATDIDENVLAGDLLNLSGFTNAANNGLKVVDSVSADSITVTGTLVDETADARLTVVGYEFESGDLEIDVSGDLPKLVSTVKDFTELGLTPGEFIYIGGDAAGTSFSAEENNGWVRVRSVAANEIVLDKTSGTMVADDGSGGEGVQVFAGRVLKNEADPTLIKRRTYQLERTLGRPDDQSSQMQAEYLPGSVASELSLNFQQADKITASLDFMSIDHELRTASQGLKNGERPSLDSCTDAFNTTSDFSRLRMFTVDPANSNPTPLFAFLTEFTVNINNNISANKAIGTLGAFDMTAGTFEVGGSLTAYFASVDAVSAVRQNSDVTLDFAIVKDHEGVVVDVPLITLGNGRLDVSQDEPITIPLDQQAARDCYFDHTICMSFFDYLPSAADS